ncbi:MAG TPA: RND family transporter, partial [Pseudomonadales bacterium]|nr:RND family transporter [Pseudomonadales bacterium]
MAGAARQYGEPYRYGDEEKRMEKLIFNHRPIWLVIIAVLTLYFGFETTKIKIDARFEKMLPMQHEYLQNMFSRLDDLTQKGLSFKIAIENTQGDIFDKEYLQVVQNVHDKVFNINGVDRTSLRSMWAPSVRWQAVTPQGFDGDRLIPGEYDGSPESLERVKLNVFRSTEIGRLISDNFKSSIVESYVFSTYPNDDLARDHKAGDTIDFQDLGNILEDIRTDINKQYNGKYHVYIIGEPKMIGDFITGSSGIVIFGGIALLITIVLLYMYARCWRAALMPLFTSVIAVVWMLGILSVMSHFSVPYGNVPVKVNGIVENVEVFSGIGLFSMLVPFLLVAIGVSHSVQYVNAMAVEMAAGHN